MAFKEKIWVVKFLVFKNTRQSNTKQSYELTAIKRALPTMN